MSQIYEFHDISSINDFPYFKIKVNFILIMSNILYKGFD